MRLRHRYLRWAMIFAGRLWVLLQAACPHASGKALWVGVSTVIAWVDRQRCPGKVSVRRQGKPLGSRLDAHKGFILELIDQHPAKAAGTP